MTMFWELKHSVIANANRQTVWKFVTNIDNLAKIEGDAVESMTLDGPYQTGSKGTTKMRGQEPIHWRLAEVEPPSRNVTEIELTGAVLRFHWTYEELPDTRTRLSQHIVLEGSGGRKDTHRIGQFLSSPGKFRLEIGGIDHQRVSWGSKDRHFTVSGLPQVAAYKSSAHIP
jgi:hypothetical protein